MNDNFSLFVPIEVIEKGARDENGVPDEILISGIASSAVSGAYDVDGEFLDVNGYDFRPFLKSGFFNLEHKGKENYKNIVGEPTNAYIKDNQFHVEGKLYKDNEQAVGIWKLGQTLKKAGSSRKIGYSIEGVPLLKDPKNPNRILKAKITGCAITISPKNDGTQLFFKGGEAEYEKQEGSELLVDITDEDGVRYTVDSELNFEKAMEAGSITGRDTTDQELTQEPLKKEDLGDKKKKKKKYNSVSEACAEENNFSKSEFYNESFSIFNLTVDSAKSFYSIAERVQRQLTPDMSVIKLTPEAIKKAEESLGLTTAEAVTVATLVAKTPEEIKKADLEDKIAKATESIELLKKELAGEPAKTETTTVATEKIEKAEIAELQKGFDSKIGSLATLLQASREENAELKKSYDDTLAKVEKIEEFTTALSNKLGLIAKQPLERKSVTTTNYIEKGGEPNTSVRQEPGVKTLSLSRDKAALATIALDASLVKREAGGVDAVLEKAVTYFELGMLPAGTELGKKIVERMLKEHKVKIVK